MLEPYSKLSVAYSWRRAILLYTLQPAEKATVKGTYQVRNSVNYASVKEICRVTIPLRRFTPLVTLQIKSAKKLRSPEL